MPAETIKKSYRVLTEDGVEIGVCIEKDLNPLRFRSKGYKVTIGEDYFQTSAGYYREERSFDECFQDICTEYRMQPIEDQTSEQPENKIKKEVVSSVKMQNTQPLLQEAAYADIGGDKSKALSPSDYLKTLEVLHDLLKRNVISRDEFDTLKDKIFAFFPEK